MELPSFIPIFPLPNVVLFPEVPLPLHIFEPRYCAMVRDALTGPGLIGMVLLRGDWQEEYHGAPEVYRTGCVGRIVETTPLPDGKFNIVLAGVREFTIVSEQRERAYRQATVEWRAEREGSPLADGLRERLIQMIERYVGRSGDDLARELLGDARLDDETLVNFFSFWLDFGPIEKQCLLEATTMDRAQRLLEVLEFHLYASHAAPHELSMRRMH
ncbi:MAG: LON peptidase substrate-binding domain-containing protein [Candidatus Binatia bacterium]